MSMFSKILGILKSILLAVIVFAAVVAIAGFLIIRFYIVPKYNQVAGGESAQHQELKTGDVIGFAKYLTDKQFIENLKNINRETAKDILVAMTEIESENVDFTAEIPKDSSAWDKNLTGTLERIRTTETTHRPAPAPEIPKSIEVTENQQSAYDRIMAAATPDEISTGLAIIAKVDVAKIKKLQSAGKNDELKEYIRSVLTQSEISTSLALYNKYKHLL